MEGSEAQRKRVNSLHPVDIVSIGVILSSVSSSRLLSSGGGGDGLDGVLHDVSKLKGLDEIPVRGENRKEREEKESEGFRRDEGGKKNEETRTNEFQIMLRSLIPIWSYLW